jgi:hypothetical protein
MRRLTVSLQQEKPSPLGRLLRVSDHPDGTSRVVLDNGVFETITIVCHSETLPALLGEDLAAIRAHLMTRAPGHFARKT